MNRCYETALLLHKTITIPIRQSVYGESMMVNLAIKKLYSMLSVIYKNSNTNEIDQGSGDQNWPLLHNNHHIYHEFLDKGIVETEWTKDIKTLRVNFPNDEKMITFS